MTLRTLLKKLFKRTEAETFTIGGIEPDLDQYALDERQECIDGIVEKGGKSVAEATALADSWFIMKVKSSVGDEPTKTRYVPRPVWDWDWAWRTMFDTHEEAVAHIESKHGRILDS